MTFKIVNSLDEKGGVYFHYNHRDLRKPHWKFQDFRQQARDLESRWIKDLEAWHSELCELGAQRTNWWWHTNAGRLVSIQSCFMNFFSAIAVLEKMKQISDTKEICLLGFPDEAIKYLQEQNLVTIVDSKATRHSAFAEMVSSFKRVLKNSLSHYKSKPATSFQIQPFETVVFTQILKPEWSDQQDHFFGGTFHNDKNVLWLASVSSLSKDQRASFISQTRNQNLVIIEDLLNSQWDRNFHFDQEVDRLKKRDWPAAVIGGYRSQLLPKAFIEASFRVESLKVEVSHQLALEAVFRFKTPKMFIYPYEEKGIEKAMLKACRNYSVHALGFAHALHNNKTHLYFKRRQKGDPPRPDYLGVTGPAAKDWFVNQGWEPEQIRILGSPRHTLAHLPSAREEKLKVLFIVGNSQELKILANFLETDPKLFEGCQLLIRRKPHSWQEEQEIELVRIRAQGFEVIESKDSLAKQIQWCDVTLFCLTSAGLEAILGGRLAVRADLNGILDVNPLVGKGDSSCIPQASNAQDLKVILMKLKNLDNSDYLALWEKQRKYAENIYAPPRFGKFKIATQDSLATEL